MASTGGKGKHKKKGKTIDLNSFLAEGENAAAPGYAPANTASSWADEVESCEVDDMYTSSNSNQRIFLPTAPKAARAPDVDMSKIPPQGPFKAFLANVPYDVDKSDIEEFFGELKLKDVKLPREGGGDNGRLKGFAYAEFEDINSLMDALSLSNETIKNRPIRIDIAGTSQDGERERGGRFEERVDRTPDDWRSAPREEQPRDARGSRNGYERSGFGDKFSGRDYEQRDSFSRNDRDFGDRGNNDRENRGSGFRDGYDRGNNDRDFRQNDRFDRGGSDRYDRGGSDRYDRGGSDRYDRGGSDRYDRGGSDRYDRGGSDRYDRGGSDRYDRGGSDRYDRGGGPDRYDRGGGPDRYDRGGGPDRFERRPNDRYERPSSDRYDRQERSGFGSDHRSDDRGFGRRERYDDRRYNNRDDDPPPVPPDDAPRERPRLQLQKRTVPVTSKAETTASSSIFGGAKPVDTASKEREVEQKLAREHNEKERRISESSDGKSSHDGSRRHDRSKEDVRSSSRNSGGKSRRDSEKSQDLSEDGYNVKDEPKQGRAVSPKRENTKLIPAPPPATNAWTRKSNLTQDLTSENANEQHKNVETKPQLSHSDNESSKKPVERRIGRNDDYSKKNNQWSREDTQGKYGRGFHSDRDRGISKGEKKFEERPQRSEKEKQPRDPAKYEDPKPQDFTSANKFAQLIMEDNSIDPGSASE